jgi:hypothetical protein
MTCTKLCYGAYKKEPRAQRQPTTHSKEQSKKTQNTQKNFQHIPHQAKAMNFNFLNKINVLEKVWNVLEAVGTRKTFQHIPTHS